MNRKRAIPIVVGVAVVVPAWRPGCCGPSRRRG
jgi:hypothetical protein